MGVRFAGLMQQSCGQADLIGIWFNPMEDYMIAHYAPQAAMTYLRGLEPWYSQMPWTMAAVVAVGVVGHTAVETGYRSAAGISAAYSESGADHRRNEGQSV